MLAEAPPSKVAAGAFYPRRIGLAGPDRVLLVSPDLSHTGVLGLDGQLGIRWVDTLAVGTGPSDVVFADGNLWLLGGDGGIAMAYRNRQLDEYRLVPDTAD